MIRIATLTALVALALTGCGASANQVPVRGGMEDKALLSGEWRGDFDAGENQRHGTIDFNLEMGRHTAEGKVVMYPTPDATPLALQIEFLKVEHNTVTGKLQPYTDPTCNCVVETEFYGDVAGDHIVGNYAVSMGGEKRVGGWTAQRIER